MIGRHAPNNPPITAVPCHSGSMNQVRRSTSSLFICLAQLHSPYVEAVANHKEWFTVPSVTDVGKELDRENILSPVSDAFV